MERAASVDGVTGGPDDVLSTVDGQDPDNSSLRRRRTAGELSRRGAWLVERWAPEGLRGARVDPGRRGAVTLVAVLVLSAALVSALVWRSRPEAEPVRPPPVLVAPATGSAGPSAGPGPSLVVAVTGRVRRPGVVTVAAGARVIDALRAAGGPLPGVDLALLNLARKLADGELVVVGVPGAATDGAGAGATPGQGAPGAGSAVNLNTATLEQLDGLPGVGPVLAQRILDRRSTDGPFTSVDQLRDVAGIGESKFTQIKDRVTV